MSETILKYPKVSIVMAIYKPRIDWFIEQLKSLDNQTYNNINLFILNDYPENEEFYKQIIFENIKKIEFSYQKNEYNMGPVASFEKLTLLADGEYIAYCDQDDIWLDDKIEKLLDFTISNTADLAFTDMYIINEDSKVIADSITKVRPLHVMPELDDYFSYLLRHSIILGCTMLVKSKIAKKSLPIPNQSGSVYHDWWISVYAAAYGKVVFLNRPLIKYRIHDHNVTAFMKGINGKEDYINRIVEFMNKMHAVRNRITSLKHQQLINDIYVFGETRKKYITNHSIENFLGMIRSAKFNYKAVGFEILLPFLPEMLFIKIIKLLEHKK